MDKPLRLRFRPGDLVAVSAIALLASAVALIFLTGSGTGPAEAEIRQNGELIDTIPLDRDTEFVISGDYENTVTVKARERTASTAAGAAAPARASSACPTWSKYA